MTVLTAHDARCICQICQDNKLAAAMDSGYTGDAGGSVFDIKTEDQLVGNIGPQGCVQGQPVNPNELILRDIHERKQCLWDTCPFCQRARQTNEEAAKRPLDATLNDRGREYGHYPLMARVAQNLKTIMHQSANWHSASLGVDKQEALDMIATKIARILCGNPNNVDSWHDIGGYARKAEEGCGASTGPVATP